MTRQKRILIIYTGGTIGMAHRRNTLVPLTLAEIKSQLPELNRLHCHLRFHAFRQPIDSSNVHPEFWQQLARVIQKNYSEHDGFVVLHGTDTMAYTAAALSFMLENLQKPVILTGSQVPLGAIRTDARRNLITAIEMATAPHPVPEVCIYFNNYLFRGNRAEKFSSSKFDAFQSLNYPPLAEAGVQIVYNNASFLQVRKSRKLRMHYGFDTAVALIKIFPGLTPDVLRAQLAIPGLKAAVIETYGSGNAPSDRAFLQVLEQAARRLLLVNVSQCSGGRVEQGKYETSIHLKEIGLVSGADMTSETAIVKLMYLLGQGYNKEETRKFMRRNLRGEVSV